MIGLLCPYSTLHKEAGRGEMSVRNNVTTLAVPDAATWKVFLAHARNAWTAAHPRHVERRGRPSSEEHIFDACITIYQQQKPSQKRHLTPGQLIRKVKDLLGVQCPSSGTVELHVKKWIARHWTLDDLSPGYLRPKEGKEICAILNAFQKLCQQC